MVEKLVTPRPGSCSVGAGASSALSLRPVVSSALAFPPSSSLHLSLSSLSVLFLIHRLPCHHSSLPSLTSLPSFLCHAHPEWLGKTISLRKAAVHYARWGTGCSSCLSCWVLLGCNWNPPGLTLSPEPLEERVLPSDVHTHGGLCPQDSLPEAPQEPGPGSGPEEAHCLGLRSGAGKRKLENSWMHLVSVNKLCVFCPSTWGFLECRSQAQLW